MPTQRMTNPQQVYLLRMWQENGEWRIRVSDLQRGEEYFFTTLEQLHRLVGQDYSLPAHGYTAQQNVWGYG